MTEQIEAAPFAAFERRFAAVIIDFFVLFFLILGAHAYLLEPMGVTSTDMAPAFVVLGMLYFTLSWRSPMSATPAQYLLRMRVVNQTGERLCLPRAAQRSVLLIVSIIAAMTLFQSLSSYYYLIIALPTIAVLLLAAVTPNRQAPHDFLARSVVVTKGAVMTPEDRSRLREYLADSDPEVRKARIPSLLRMSGTVAVAAIPIIVLLNVALMNFDRELRYRIGYALGETRLLQAALRERRSDVDHWGTTATELGVATKVDYPDGGYYELEGDGVIRIRFTEIPKLKRISLVLSPRWKDDELIWECRVEGEVSNGVLPAECRD